jgi:hypothetical protein
MRTNVAALVSLLGLCACAQLPVYDEWEARPSHPALPAVVLAVDARRIADECGTYPGGYVHGCARPDYDARICRIYTRADPEPWLVAHERRHCDGWDHAALPDVPLDVTTAAVRREARERP